MFLSGSINFDPLGSILSFNLFHLLKVTTPVPNDAEFRIEYLTQWLCRIEQILNYYAITTESIFLAITDLHS